MNSNRVDKLIRAFEKSFKKPKIYFQFLMSEEEWKEVKQLESQDKENIILVYETDDEQ